MTHKTFYDTSTRREALKNMAAVGGLAAAGSVVAPGLFSTSAAAAAGNQLIVAVSATPVSLDPEYGASLESWELPVFIYEYLFCYYFKKGPDGVGAPQFEPPYEPRLAESVETSADGKTLTFRLRKGVKSEYGNEFTAEDVKWSWDRTFALNTAGMWMMKSSSIRSADAIRVIEPYVLEVGLAGPNSLLMTEQATSLNNPVIYDSTEAKKHATDSDPWAKDWLAKNSATFGPYRVVQFTPGQQVVFEINPNYYRDRPKIDRVIWREVPSSATRLQLLLAGSVHIAKELDLRERQECEGKPGVKVTAIKGNEGVIFGLNNQVKPFDNVKVRQAIAYAAPVDAIIETVYLNQPERPALQGVHARILSRGHRLLAVLPDGSGEGGGAAQGSGPGTVLLQAGPECRPTRARTGGGSDSDAAQEARHRRPNRQTHAGDLPGTVLLAQGGGRIGAGRRMGGRPGLLAWPLLRVRPQLGRQLDQLPER